MNHSTARIGIVGATGYAGMELMRLVLQHPSMRLTYLAGSKARVEGIQDTFEHLAHVADLRIEKYDPDRCRASCDLVFVALPSGESGAIAVDLWQRGLRVVDLSGDLRLPGALYQKWYGKQPVCADALDAAVYGLTEFNREAIAQASLIANPGCYATAAILALKPLVKHASVNAAQPVMIDAKSGVTGAGRRAQTPFQFAELANDFYAYRVGQHQHTPEIEQALDGSLQVLLTTQLLPIPRGIFVSAYVTLAGGDASREIYHDYVNFYAESPFVDVLAQGKVPHLKSVQGTNRCQIGMVVDTRTHVLQVFSVIDNLQKGAAGQALQNANVMCGYDETAGLDTIALWM